MTHHSLCIFVIAITLVVCASMVVAAPSRYQCLFENPEKTNMTYLEFIKGDDGPWGMWVRTNTTGFRSAAVYRSDKPSILASDGSKDRTFFPVVESGPGNVRYGVISYKSNGALLDVGLFNDISLESVYYDSGANRVYAPCVYTRKLPVLYLCSMDADKLSKMEMLGPFNFPAGTGKPPMPPSVFVKDSRIFYVLVRKDNGYRLLGLNVDTNQTVAEVIVNPLDGAQTFANFLATDNAKEIYATRLVKNNTEVEFITLDVTTGLVRVRSSRSFPFIPSGAHLMDAVNQRIGFSVDMTTGTWERKDVIGVYDMQTGDVIDSFVMPLRFRKWRLAAMTLLR